MQYVAAIQAREFVRDTMYMRIHNQRNVGVISHLARVLAQGLAFCQVPLQRRWMDASQQDFCFLVLPMPLRQCQHGDQRGRSSFSPYLLGQARGQLRYVRWVVMWCINRSLRSHKFPHSVPSETKHGQWWLIIISSAGSRHCVWFFLMVKSPVQGQKSGKKRGRKDWTKHTSKHIPIICLFVDPTSYSWYFAARFFVVFVSKDKLQWYFGILWDSLALEDVHVLQDPKWRQKTLRRRFLRFFWACLHILCPLRNAITPPKTMSLKSSSWTLTLKQGMCGVGSSIDFPKPKIQGFELLRLRPVMR